MLTDTTERKLRRFDKMLTKHSANKIVGLGNSNFVQETQAQCPIAKYLAVSCRKGKAMPYWNKQTTDAAELANENALLYPANAETIIQVQRLLRQIEAYEGAKRASAEQALQDMGMEGALAIRALLAPKIQKRKKSERYDLWLSLSTFVCFWTVFPFMHIVLPMLPKDARPHAALAILPIVALGIIPPLMQALKSFSPPKWEVQALLKLQDKCMLPILLDVQRLVAGQAEGFQINKAIASLLPTLQASDAILLTSEHRQTLNDSLRFSGRRVLGRMADVDYIVVLLAALQQIGDHTALPHVEHLARSARQQRVREAAQECLLFLEQRAMAKGQTLLHPASSPDTYSSALVRPASASEDAAPRQLLRASAFDQDVDNKT